MSRYIKEVQKVQLNIFKQLVKVLENEGLRYVAIGGTALGIYRHQGFIPWDDDLDIAMPREDYERFLKLQNKLPDDLFIQHFSTEKEYLLYFAKVRQKGTTYLEKRDIYQKINHGIWIDIFPLDAVSGDRLKRAAKVRQLERQFARANRNYAGVFGKLKSLMYRAVYPRPEEGFRILDDYVKSCPDPKSTKVSPHSSTWMLDFSDVFPVNHMFFEGIEMAVPNNIEAYLSDRYGDFMKLPPEEERVAPHAPIEVKT